MNSNKVREILEEYRKVGICYRVKAILIERMKSALRKQYHKEVLAGSAEIRKALQGYVDKRLAARERGRFSLAEFEAVEALKSKNKDRSVLDIKREVKSVLKPLNALKNDPKIKVKIGREYKAELNSLVNEASLYFSNINFMGDFASKALLAFDKYSTINTNLINEVCALVNRIGIKLRAEKIAERNIQVLKAKLDKIEAEKNQAIGFLWITMEDERVVGNPTGLYPKVYDETAHGDHWGRHNKIVVYRNDDYKAISKTCGAERLLKPSEILDGFPSDPYGCRCVAIQIGTLKEAIDFLETTKQE